MVLGRCLCELRCSSESALSTVEGGAGARTLARHRLQSGRARFLNGKGPNLNCKVLYCILFYLVIYRTYRNT